MRIEFYHKLAFTMFPSRQRHIELPKNCHRIDQNVNNPYHRLFRQVSSRSEDKYSISHYCNSFNSLRCRLYRNSSANRSCIFETSHPGCPLTPQRKLLRGEKDSAYSTLLRLPYSMYDLKIFHLHSYSPPHQNLSPSRFLFIPIDVHLPSATPEYHSLSSSTTHIIFGQKTHVSH